MIKILMSKKSSYLFLLIISTLLLFLPFIWFGPGEIDLGGDSGRLYLLDPYAFFVHASLYPQVPGGTGVMLPPYYHIPFILLLMGLDAFIGSPYILSNLLNGVKLVVGFLAIYLIVIELVAQKKKTKVDVRLFLTSVAAGIFYVFAPSMTGNMERALLSHNQIFLNPLLFYFFLKFLLTYKYYYGWIALGITLLFAPNFGFPSMPAFFAFYPLAILFLILYVVVIKRKKISVKNIALFIISFIGLHVFHLVPQLTNLLEPQSYVNSRVFDTATIAHEGVRYFIAVLPLAKASNNFLYTIDNFATKVLFAIVPLIILVGLFFNKQKDKTILLIASFFLVTFFLMTANITGIGVELYKSLYYVPGFSMFRNFIGQWQFVYAFFYSLLFGYALYIILTKLTIRLSWIFVGVLVGLLLFLNRDFVTGIAVNKSVNNTSGLKTGVVFDSSYKETLTYIKNNPYDFKILSLPFTDCCYQVVKGANSGGYVGTTPIAHLTGKNDYTGYETVNPFPEFFLRASREQDYHAINQLLGILNIEYIFHNSDPKIYDTSFPKQPYEYVRQSLPATQKGYQDFIEKLGAVKVYENGKNKVYKISEAYMLPHIYSPSTLISIDSIKSLRTGFPEHTIDSRQIAYVGKDDCKKAQILSECGGKNFQSDDKSIYFKKINPTKYQVRIDNPPEKMMLVFSEAYHPGWKLYPVDVIQKDTNTFSYANSVTQGKEGKLAIDTEWWKNIGVRPAFDNTHILVNGYANGWIIDNPKKERTLSFVLALENQRLFYIAAIVSGVFIIIYLLQGLLLIKKKILL